MSVHVFITSQDNWLLEGVRCALQTHGVEADVTMVNSAGDLLNHVVGGANALPAGSLLLPVFPDNQMLTCFRSLTFLSEWRALQHGLFRIQAPCLLWGQSPVIRWDGPYIPWRISPRDLGQSILRGIQAWRSPARNRLLREVFRSVRLSPREAEVLRYTMEGHSLVWMAEKLGVTSKTVWTHRHRAMNLLGIRRLHELTQLPGDAFL
ncbi:helix-turn-helix transcriptional regulator [Salmonella enterica]|nr:helix-turn-helix transcriptional regulator [Salmonella enterica]